MYGLFVYFIDVDKLVGVLVWNVKVNFDDVCVLFVNVLVMDDLVGFI